jgi:(p)ppGpp synthase/HD superfamily hydrolase
MISPTDVPEFAGGSPLLEGAYRMARDAHAQRSNDGTNIDHPVEVAELLSAEGFDEQIVAAALLHDVIEDTDTEPEEIEVNFGHEVARLVTEMTERGDIPSYERRKAEHRTRVVGDRNVAAIYAADKLSGARELVDDPSSAPGAKVDHYLRALGILCESYPDLPFLGELRSELERLMAADSGT